MVDLAPALTAALIVVIGWMVVERFARRRETRTDLRSAVTSFTNAVDEIRVAAVSFYGLAGNDPQAASLAATIKGKIGTLADQIAILRSAGMLLESDELLKRFRQTVTGGDFDGQARLPLPSNAQLFVAIAADAQALVRVVQSEMLRFLLPPRRLRWGRRGASITRPKKRSMRRRG